MVFDIQTTATVVILPFNNQVTNETPKYYQFTFSNYNDLYGDLLNGIKHIDPNLAIQAITWYNATLRKHYPIFDESSMQYAVTLCRPLQLYVYKQNIPTRSSVFVSGGITEEMPVIMTRKEYGPRKYKHISYQQFNQMDQNKPDLPPLPVGFGQSVGFGSLLSQSQWPSFSSTPNIPSTVTHSFEQKFVEPINDNNLIAGSVTPVAPPWMNEKYYQINAKGTNIDSFERTSEPKNIFEMNTKPYSTQSDLHFGCKCDGCQKAIYGIRYKCQTCEDYDLCEECKNTGRHAHHQMKAIPPPQNDHKYDKKIWLTGGETQDTMKEYRISSNQVKKIWDESSVEPVNEIQKKGGWHALRKKT